MPYYQCKFSGKLKGSIGNTSGYTVKVIAENEEAARIKLYATHEHISGVTYTILDPAEYYRDQLISTRAFITACLIEQKKHKADPTGYKSHEAPEICRESVIASLANVKSGINSVLCQGVSGIDFPIMVKVAKLKKWPEDRALYPMIADWLDGREIDYSKADL